MARTWIVVGDATTHGGTVVSGSPFTGVDGKPVARISDSVACPKCGPTTIVSGDATIVIDGQPVARHGDATTCGATLIAGKQARAFIDAGAASGGSAESALAGVAAIASALVAGSAFDEAFILKSAETGKPLGNRRYRITRANGAIDEGTTDDEGKTGLVTSEAAETVRIELEEEGP
jgi:uncharacterized Zn-binding protein involved in type VI secretion